MTESTTVTVEDVTPVRKRLAVEVPASMVQRTLDHHYTDLGQRSRLRGFRPGKAPRAILEKMFGDQVKREVVGHLVEETFYSAIESNQLAVVGTPEIEAGELSPGQSLKYTATVDVRPRIDFGADGLDGLEATRTVEQVVDEHVEKVLNGLRESAARLHPIEDRHVVESGDIVTVDLSTTIDGGQPVRREGVMLEAGSGTFPLSLEQQLIGQVRGARAHLTVPYPADYGNPSLAGKNAEFDIEVTDLRAKQLPVLDDEFARDQAHCESLAELRGKIRSDLEARANHQADALVRQQLLEQLAGKHSFEVPKSMVERRCEVVMASMNVRLPEGAAGQEAAERIRAELRPRAEQEVRMELLLDAVADREGLSVDDDRISAEIDAIAQQEQQAPERVRAFYERPEARAALRARILRESAMEKLLSRAKIMPAGGPG